MAYESVVGILMMIVNGLVTWQGLTRPDYFEKYKFNVDGILVYRERIRLISSGFLHVNWIHFAFNMIALMSFAPSLERLFTVPGLLLLYFASLLGGNLLALYIHRNHGDYSAVGASGAVSGVVLASIVLFPDNEIGLILIPIHFPAWILGILFVLISIFGIKNQSGNIGHEAHLGGALTGIIGTLLIDHSRVFENWWIFLLLLLPTLAFLILIVRNPAVLYMDNYWGETWEELKKGTREPKDSPLTREEELNRILDKIREKGFKSLTRKERDRLKDLRDL
ncbi:MAG: rhomboid family intramembrane serine protease [Bacteroidetes bacterium]|nr:MAG: rhomboid family intramembrane serine protease [Bacteroidota bacterium]